MKTKKIRLRFRPGKMLRSQLRAKGTVVKNPRSEGPRDYEPVRGTAQVRSRKGPIIVVVVILLLTVLWVWQT